jgi:UDPglucose 6-dehydrogenase
VKVAVLGLWHLGSVTAACLAAAGHEVIGWDPDPDTVRALADGRPPVAEPGLAALVAEDLASKRLRFTGDVAEATRSAEVVWIAFDTPVDDDDRADVEYVVDQVQRAFPSMQTGTLVLLSSQLPVGTVARLEAEWRAANNGREASFACSPENLRLGKALEVFTRPDRVIVGVRTDHDRARISALLAPITDRIEWMSVESAEMTKHAINAFLATSVTFINEIAALCERCGADAREVERGLKTEQRIGPRAYLGPGGAFAGGTLARDIAFLEALGRQKGLRTPLLDGVEASNREHRSWHRRRLESLLETVNGRTIAVWGLTYKPGTDTLRRSTAVELCRWLIESGASVRAHDPAVTALPAELADATLCGSPLEAASGADAVVVATPWPEFRSVDAEALATAMPGRVVLDADRFLSITIGRDPRFELVSVGTAAPVSNSERRVP